MNRREFIKAGLALVGASALVPTVFQNALVTLQQQAVRGGPADDGRVLVLVQLAGGNDGLNTVIPFTDTRYYESRPDLSLAQGSVLPLNSTTGFHPAMGKLKELWDQGVIAIVEGVGYNNQNFSHFASMDIWQTADPSLKLADGWLGRYYAKHKDDLEVPFLGLAVGSTLPTSFRTPAVAVPSVNSISNYQFKTDTQAPTLASLRFQALQSLYEDSGSAGDYGSLLHRTLQTAVTSIKIIQDAHAKYKTSVQYPSGGLGTALQLIAEAVAANVGAKVYHVSIGGFDTHANQIEDHPRQLNLLSAALHTFYSDLKNQGLHGRVLVMTWSEFGRRVKANASQGTDHGSAAPLFFIGAPVKGGLYGQRPSLENLDNGNLRYTVDFRSVYATALESWLGVSSQEILGDVFELIPLLK